MTGGTSARWTTGRVETARGAAGAAEVTASAQRVDARGRQVIAGVLAAALWSALLGNSPVATAQTGAGESPAWSEFAAPLPAIPQWREDFLGSDALDLVHTSAWIDTAPPGRAELPPAHASLAWHPRHAALLVGTTEGVSLWRADAGGGGLAQDPRLAIPAPDVVGVGWLGGPGELSIGGTGDAFAVAMAHELRVYRLDAEGRAILTDVWPSPDPLTGLATDGNAVWIAHPGGLHYLGLTPLGLVEVPEFALSPPAPVRAISTHASGLLAVLLDEELRLYRRGPDGFVEWTEGRLDVRAGGRGVSFWGDRSGLWTLHPGRLDAVAIGPSGSRLIPGWSRAIPRHAAAVASVGSGLDHSVLAMPAVETSSWIPTTASAEPLPDRSLAEVPGRRFAERAEVRSRVWEVEEPLEQVRLEAGLSLPPGTGVYFHVTTDGGDTWTEVPPDQIVAVPPGVRVAYRAVLASADALATPELDWVDLSEVRTLTILTRAARVRLVR